jgi:(p)ppGpp synthase/HD superfamily hydrolase
MNHNTKAKIVALAAASGWHAGQRYGDQDYTEAHLLPVATSAEASDFRDSENDRTDTYLVGVFHDTVEDRKATEADIVELLTPVIGEVRASRVAEMVGILARQAGERYFDYIERLTQSPMARLSVLLVKHADLVANLSSGAKGLPSLAKRYERALEMISPILYGDKP